MAEPLDVYLYGVKVAELDYLAPLRYRLSYLEGWASRPDALPLSHSLPLTSRVHDGDILLHFLDNLLPDGERVRERWAIEAGLDRAEPFELLRAYGREVAGAATFTPRGEPPTTDGILTPTDDDEIAQRIRRLRSDDSDWIDPASAGGKFSLGGAQGKFALAREADSWWEPDGASPTTHIFKPRVAGVTDGEVVEYVIMTAASALGLVTAPVELGVFEGEQSLVVQRFDRARSGNEIIRLHQEDLCQAMGYPRLRKYEQYGGPGYRQILEFLERHADSRARQRFAQSVFFSWLVLNTDAHAKNYSIQSLPDRTVLAPLYDLSSLLPYIRPDDPDARAADIAATRLSLRLVDDYRAGAMTHFEWRGAARDAGLPPNEFIEWARGISELLPLAVDAAVESLPSSVDDTIAERLSQRVHERSRDAIRMLSTPLRN